MKYLSCDQVIEIHDVLIDEFGGLPGFRDRGLLESALAAPMMAVFGKELYETVFDKAAAYLHGISRNHPFNDGNKRTASAVTLMFLRINGKSPKYDTDKFIEFVLKVAHEKLDVQHISKHLEKICH